MLKQFWGWLVTINQVNRGGLVLGLLWGIGWTLFWGLGHGEWTLSKDLDKSLMFVLGWGLVCGIISHFDWWVSFVLFDLIFSLVSNLASGLTCFVGSAITAGVVSLIQSAAGATIIQFAFVAFVWLGFGVLVAWGDRKHGPIHHSHDD